MITFFIALTTGILGVMVGATMMLAAIQKEISEHSRVTIGKHKYDTNRIEETT